MSSVAFPGKTQEEKDLFACETYLIESEGPFLPPSVLRKIGYSVHGIWKHGRVLGIRVREYGVCSFSERHTASVRIEYREKRQKKNRVEWLTLERIGDSRWVVTKIGY